jgi:hypothetical protein
MSQDKSFLLYIVFLGYLVTEMKSLTNTKDQIFLPFPTGCKVATAAPDITSVIKVMISNAVCPFSKRANLPQNPVLWPKIFHHWHFGVGEEGRSLISSSCCGINSPTVSDFELPGQHYRVEKRCQSLHYIGFLPSRFSRCKVLRAIDNSKL